MNGGPARGGRRRQDGAKRRPDRKSTRLNSSHSQISYAVFCLKKKKKKIVETIELNILLSAEYYLAVRMANDVHVLRESTRFLLSSHFPAPTRDARRSTLDAS